MSWIPDHRATPFLLALSSASAGCGFERPPDPPPFDCAAIDRAAERFPAECGALEELDAGITADASSRGPDGEGR
jgi:hypothetical protein